MYCQCKMGNNYQVVGLCDPSQFSTEPRSNAWTQLTIPEILPLPDCYPDIENIERIYVSVQITSTKPISTPVFGVPNLEGDILTGNKLIVHGKLCQTVVYTANTCDQSLHSVNFRYPFCACITLGTMANLTNKFCVESCIEDVYAGKLNDRTLFKSVTVFLIATVQGDICDPVPPVPDPDPVPDPEIDEA